MTKTSKRSPIARAATDRLRENVEGDPGGSSYLGDLVAWDMADNDGFRASRSEVRELFERNGFEDCVDDSKDIARAMLAAMRIGHRGADILVAPMDRKNKDTPVAIAVYKNESNEGERGDDWKPGARVRAVDDDAAAMPMEGETVFDGECMRVARSIATKANELCTHITNTELSGALTTAGKQAWWSPYRRKKGGVYFIDARLADGFRDVLDGLEVYGGFYPVIQPLFADENGRTVGNVARASEGMLEGELKRLRADLTRATDKGNMRESTVEKRIAECDAEALFDLAV